MSSQEFSKRGLHFVVQVNTNLPENGMWQVSSVSIQTRHAAAWTEFSETSVAEDQAFASSYATVRQSAAALRSPTRMNPPAL